MRNAKKPFNMQYPQPSAASKDSLYKTIIQTYKNWSTDQIECTCNRINEIVLIFSPLDPKSSVWNVTVPVERHQYNGFSKQFSPLFHLTKQRNSCKRRSILFLWLCDKTYWWESVYRCVKLGSRMFQSCMDRKMILYIWNELHLSRKSAVKFLLRSWHRS